MRTMTPLERRILTLLDDSPTWWSISELWEHLNADDQTSYVAIVSALSDLRRAGYLERMGRLSDSRDAYKITVVGQSSLTRPAA
jgi:DNA-binding PadR family transcriptional regulator